ncbi:hypothetical protein A3C96_04140 [Candidatus Uhrbacteria bacterium RIFCSPHIGHO2_02_FULL_60_10]|uniref:DUF2933 domain-containing protein n=1 Tax=Candidatus Uhrbacteria bacterium RIFCSPHIGHO2_02_FULL_60_10 TaxID=1802392 RepID=A0A1F7U4C6_9BACT|nr:MAG: hypothetical protein A3C96_04140 [Candidatus Uhrbacteria bacterium RIFCSPHIGHO2_02_FULL_60_10]
MNQRSGAKYGLNWRSALVGGLVISGIWFLVNYGRNFGNYLPFISLLACVLMMRFMHGAHGAHGKHDHEVGDEKVEDTKK